MRDLQEDHRFEQFFFDDPTTTRLATHARSFTHPLLLCLPSVAQRLDRCGHPYTLLDRDRRFEALRGFIRFDLFEPHLITGRFDAVLCDPPFANVPLDALARVVDLLASGQPRPVAVGLAYIDTRQPALLDAFAHVGLRRAWGPLGYRSVAPATQARIQWYEGAYPKRIP